LHLPLADIGTLFSSFSERLPTTATVPTCPLTHPPPH
jgi:hypothetical protein